MEANRGPPLSTPPPDALALAAGPPSSPTGQPAVARVHLRPSGRIAVLACPVGVDRVSEIPAPPVAQGPRSPHGPRPIPRVSVNLVLLRRGPLGLTPRDAMNHYSQ